MKGDQEKLCFPVAGGSMVVFFVVLSNMPCATVQEKPFIVIIPLDFIDIITFKQPGISLFFSCKGLTFYFQGMSRIVCFIVIKMWHLALNQYVWISGSNGRNLFGHIFEINFRYLWCYVNLFASMETCILSLRLSLWACLEHTGNVCTYTYLHSIIPLVANRSHAIVNSWSQ